MKPFFKVRDYKYWDISFHKMRLYEYIFRLEGKEYEDLDVVINKMKHWAHRLYPKLPFDDVTKQIGNLGKKMQIQTNLKKIRMGEDVDPYFDKDVVDKDDQNGIGSDDDPMDTGNDDVQRYFQLFIPSEYF